MMPKNSKTIGQIFSALVMGLALLISLGVDNSTNSKLLAQTSSDATKVVPANESSGAPPIEGVGCEEHMFNFAQKEFGDFQKYLSTSFSSKQASSLILVMATERYQLLKDRLYKEMSQFFGNNEINKSRVLSERLVELSNCENTVRDTIEEAGKLLEMSATTNAGAKKTAIFVEKYQQINGKLRVLQTNFLEMTKNYMTFNQKLPCYAKTCL